MALPWQPNFERVSKIALTLVIYRNTRNSSADGIANVNFLYDDVRPPYWTK